MNSSVISSPYLASAYPVAQALIHGSDTYPLIRGIAKFYKQAFSNINNNNNNTTNNNGLIVEIILENLPKNNAFVPSFLGLHIHENGDCSMNFTKTGMHFNPEGAEHPHHLGDLPPVLNSDGNGYLVFYDSYLSLNDIENRSILLHSKRDDFTTQPSGDSGDKIACGVIRSTI